MTYKRSHDDEPVAAKGEVGKKSRMDAKSNPSDLTTISAKFEKSDCLFTVQGCMSKGERYVEGIVREEGTGTQEVSLKSLNNADLNELGILNSGKIQIGSDVDSELDTSTLNKESTLTANLPNQRAFPKFSMYFSTELEVKDLKNPVSEDEGISFMATGSKNTIDDIDVLFGGGGVSICITSGENANKIRFVPELKEVVTLTWEKKENSIFVMCK